MNYTIKLRAGARLDLSEDLLKKIEKFGAVQFSPVQLADILGADREDVKDVLMHQEKHPFNVAYHKGRLQAEFQLREKVFDLANKNSSQAQELAKRFIDENRIHLV